MYVFLFGVVFIKEDLLTAALLSASTYFDCFSIKYLHILDSILKNPHPCSSEPDHEFALLRKIAILH
jgi:hypothetical protein